MLKEPIVSRSRKKLGTASHPASYNRRDLNKLRRLSPSFCWLRSSHSVHTHSLTLVLWSQCLSSLECGFLVNHHFPDTPPQGLPCFRLSPSHTSLHWPQGTTVSLQEAKLTQSAVSTLCAHCPHSLPAEVGKAMGRRSARMP